MIRSKLGTQFRKAKKAAERLFCALLASLVLFSAATAPVRAAGALAAISGASVVAAFLMASGIYPFVSDDSQSFGEWGAETLTDLLTKYNETHVANQIRLAQVTAFITGKTLAIGSAIWSQLRDFASWIVSEFSLTDNQTGVELQAVASSSFSNVPVFRFSEYSNAELHALALSDGLFYLQQLSLSGTTISYYALANHVGWEIVHTNLGITACIDSELYDSSVSFGGSLYTFDPINQSAQIKVFNLVSANGDTGFFTGARRSIVYGTHTLYYWYASSSGFIFPDTIPNISGNTAQAPANLAQYYYGLYDNYEPSSRGVTVDTTNVSVPAELPIDTPYGGLTISDAATGTPTAIETVIEQGVTDREQPVVIPTTVEIPADIEITDDGTIIENPVVVTPEMALPSVADLTLPAAVIENFKTKFPFCLPWDILSFLQPLSVTPAAPVITCNIPDPFTNTTYTITVDLSSWSEIAAVVRQFESVILAVGFALGFRKFVLVGSHS